MNQLRRNKYALTVNAFTLEDIQRVEQALKQDSRAKDILKMDACYGPNEQDGSYLAMFSSDSMGIHGYVPAWSERAYLKLFSGIRKNAPSARFVLKGTPLEDGASGFVKIIQRIAVSS